MVSKNIAISVLALLLLSAAGFMLYDKVINPKEEIEIKVEEKEVVKELSADEKYKEYVENLNNRPILDYSTFASYNNSIYFIALLNENKNVDIYLHDIERITFNNEEDKILFNNLNNQRVELFEGENTNVYQTNIGSVSSIHSFLFNQDGTNILFFLMENGDVYYFANTYDLGSESVFTSSNELNIEKSEKLKNIVSFMEYGTNYGAVVAIDIEGNAIEFDETY